MDTRSRKASSEERAGTDDDAEDGEIRDASVVIADLSTAVTTLASLAKRSEEDRKDIRDVLGNCANAPQDMQDYQHTNRNTSMVKHDPIISGVLR